ncbi:MAG: hypothetical protein IPK52_21250 [Chloroflexi bacterium]|nr:hypothetical protein [Chloroflexota bacterium]
MDAAGGREWVCRICAGIPLGGGEVYLTHAEWVAGNPTQLTWVLPGTGYSGSTFRLQALVGGVVICTDETEVRLPGQEIVCPDLDLQPPWSIRRKASCARHGSAWKRSTVINSPCSPPTQSARRD